MKSWMLNTGWRILDNGCWRLGAKLILICILCIFTSAAIFGQADIPIGTWRLHLSYNTVTHISLSDNKIFGAAESGVLVFDRTDNSLSSYNTLNGLSGTGISALQYDESHGVLLIGYADGNLDIVKDNAVINFNRLKNSDVVAGTKSINHIVVRGNLAYCATDYGVVVFDLQNLELRETWRDLGATGGKLKIFQSVFVGDSIFLASQKGVLAGNLNDNLLDFSNWKRYDTGDLSNPVQCIESFNNKIYITINELGIYHRENGSWFKESFLQGSEYSSLHANGLGFLLIVEDQKLWTLNGTNQLNPVADDNLQSPITAIQDETGSFWAGDGQNGLVSNFSGAFESYLPDGPSTNKTFRLKFNDKKIYAVAGGFTSLGMPLGQTGAVNIFENGSWKSLTQTPTDITDIDFMNNSTFTASFGYGLQAETSGTTLLYNENNSPLQNLNPPNKAVYISAVESSSDGLWVANYGATQPLHLLKNSSWQSFSFAFSQARYITDIDVDIFGKAWMTLNPLQGGGILVFDASKNKSTLITDAAGSGALPNKSVRSLAVDRDGYMWAGTDAGVGYFINEDDDIIKPIFENRFLLKDEKITAIAVDGGNRKWIGTEHGVWLFNSTGEELVHNFTQANSPLLSDIVKDIAIHGESGEVFFATDKGIISFRGDAVSGTESFQRIKIFPNPVTAAFNGMVGITGLATDATVKITDINGKLVWQTQANGGSAAWNVRDYNGRRATTGIYLVFAASADGTGSEVGKIAIID